MIIQLSQEEIMKLASQKIEKDCGITCKWDELIFEIQDDDGNLISYSDVQIYKDHG